MPYRKNNGIIEAANVCNTLKVNLWGVAFKFKIIVNVLQCV